MLTELALAHYGYTAEPPRSQVHQEAQQFETALCQPQFHTCVARTIRVGNQSALTPIPWNYLGSCFHSTQGSVAKLLISGLTSRYLRPNLLSSLNKRKRPNGKICPVRPLHFNGSIANIRARGKDQYGTKINEGTIFNSGSLRHHIEPTSVSTPQYQTSTNPV